MLFGIRRIESFLGKSGDMFVRSYSLFFTRIVRCSFIFHSIFYGTNNAPKRFKCGSSDYLTLAENFNDTNRRHLVVLTFQPPRTPRKRWEDISSVKSDAPGAAPIG